MLAQLAGPILPGTSAAGVARQLRRVIFFAGREPMNEVLSGHRADGAAAEIPHLAVVPLPDVGAAEVTGALLGVALVLPPQASREDRARLRDAVDALGAQYLQRHRAEVRPAVELLLAETGVMVLSAAPQYEVSELLLPETWCAPARCWATVTPIALDRNPRALGHHDPAKHARAVASAVESIQEAARRQGLPTPEVELARQSMVHGGLPANEFPRFPPAAAGRDREARVLVHAVLTFPEAVAGPLILGAGRYYGLGLCWRISS